MCIFLFQGEMDSDRHVACERDPCREACFLPGRSNRDFPGLLPTLGPLPKLDPSVQLVEEDVCPVSAFLSILGRRHRRGGDLVCWQVSPTPATFRNVCVTGAMPRSALELPGARVQGESISSVRCKEGADRTRLRELRARV